MVHLSILGGLAVHLDSAVNIQSAWLRAPCTLAAMTCHWFTPLLINPEAVIINAQRRTCLAWAHQLPVCTLPGCSV